MRQQPQHSPATPRLTLDNAQVPVLILEGVCDIPAVHGEPSCFYGDRRMMVVPETPGYTEKVIPPLPGWR